MTQGVGVAVKIADGGYRAVGPALVAVLDQLELIPSGVRRRLAPGRGLEPIVNLSPGRA
jgi:L-asparaginase II